MQKLSSIQIKNLLTELNNRLAIKGIQIHMNIYGGTVMCLEFDARPGTKDILL